MRIARSLAPPLAGLLIALAGASARGDEPEAAGRFVSVPGSLSGDAVSRLLQSATEEFTRFNAANRARPLDQKQVFKIIFDFTPQGKPAGSDDYEFCLKLANGIRKLQEDGAQTTAYVHGEASRHTVLAVLACQQIVMSTKAKIGPVMRDAKAPPEDVRAAYQRIATRLAGSPDLVARLFDREMVIVPSRKGGWVDANKVNEAAGGKALFERGDPAEFDFARAKQVGLCELDARESREDLATAYRLPRASLEENPLAERVVAVRIILTGEVNSSLKEQLERRIRKATSDKANLIILELRCGGGDVSGALRVANYLAGLNADRPDRPVVTVGYVTPDARDTATIVALGCSFIAMSSEQDSDNNYRATLGGFGQLLEGWSAADLKELAAGVAELAEKRHYSPTLARGFVSHDDKLYFVKSAKGAREWAVLTDRQLTEDRKERPGHWQMPALPIPVDKHGFVLLRADDTRNREARDSEPTAVSLNLADRVCTLEELYKDYGLTASQVKVVGSDWLDSLAEFLRHELVLSLLFLIGMACLFLELKMPGVSLPGVIAALCFVLIFWANSQGVGGQITWLAILLFLLGLVLLGVEVFVLPGFGVCGISGILLVLSSLALVSYGKWPQGAEDWGDLCRRLAPFGISLMGSVVLAVLLARYLPSIPFFNRLILKPQAEETEVVEVDPARAKLAALLGAIGVAATPLRPAGKVQFGEEFIDVVAEGSYVHPGTRVQVIEIEGNRVVVKAV